MKLYSIIAFVSVIIRNYYLPNPFECFGEKATLMNLIAGWVVGIVSYALVGLVYQKGDAPAIGSLLYLVTYAAIIGVLMILGVHAFAWWWILTLVVGVIAIIMVGKFIYNKIAMV